MDKLTQLASHTVVNLGREITLGFPPRKRVTLKYADTYVFTSVAGAVSTQQFRVNACYDPDATGTGHQPRGFDQWCASGGPYTRYRVLRSRVAIEAAVQGPTESLMQMAAGFSDLSSLPSLPSGSTAITVAPQAELRGWKAVLVPASGGAPPVTLRFEASIADIEGVRPSAIESEDNYSALYSAAPADVAWFSIQANALNGGSATCEAQVELEFDVQFEEPILLAAS